MKVTGTQLRGRLAALALQLDAQTKAFDDALRQYPGEDKNPQDIMNEIVRLEYQITTLQTAQQWYNLQVTIMSPDENPITLAAAVKLIGGLSRIAKLWRNALPAKDRYRLNALDVRSADQEREQYTLTPTQIIAQITTWSNATATMTARVAIANTHEVEIPWLNASDLA